MRRKVRFGDPGMRSPAGNGRTKSLLAPRGFVCQPLGLSLRFSHAHLVRGWINTG